MLSILLLCLCFSVSLTTSNLQSENEADEKRLSNLDAAIDLYNSLKFPEKVQQILWRIRRQAPAAPASPASKNDPKSKQAQTKKGEKEDDREQSINEIGEKIDETIKQLQKDQLKTDEAINSNSSKAHHKSDEAIDKFLNDYQAVRWNASTVSVDVESMQFDLQKEILQDYYNLTREMIALAQRANYEATERYIKIHKKIINEAKPYWPLITKFLEDIKEENKFQITPEEVKQKMDGIIKKYRSKFTVNNFADVYQQPQLATNSTAEQRQAANNLNQASLLKGVQQINPAVMEIQIEQLKQEYITKALQKFAPLKSIAKILVDYDIKAKNMQNTFNINEKNYRAFSTFDLYPYYLFLKVRHINEAKVVENLFDAINKTLDKQNKSMTMRQEVDKGFQKLRKELLKNADKKLPTKEPYPLNKNTSFTIDNASYTLEEIIPYLKNVRFRLVTRFLAYLCLFLFLAILLMIGFTLLDMYILKV